MFKIKQIFYKKINYMNKINKLIINKIRYINLN